MKVYDGVEPDGPERIKVGIAEFGVTTDGAPLTTSGLGSCVGVALSDPVAGVAGLVHVMLPSANDADGAEDDPAKFADSGTELLLSELECRGADTGNVEARIAGGSDMLDFSDEDGSIGTRNARVVRDVLEAHGVPVVGADVGGDHGRSLRFEPRTGDLLVRSANDQDRRL